MTAPKWWPKAVPYDPDPLAQIAAALKATEDLPPFPRCLVASRDVPFGTTWRMWLTNGDLIVYVNRAWVASLARYEPTVEVIGLTVPVIFDE